MQNIIADRRTAASLITFALAVATFGRSLSAAVAPAEAGKPKAIRDHRVCKGVWRAGECRMQPYRPG